MPLAEFSLGAFKKMFGNDEIHCSVAIVDEIIIEKDEILLKVTLHPTGEKPLVRMNWIYAGNGFGLYILPEIEDEVLCVFPNGDLNRGVCILRFNNAIDKIPEKVAQDKFLMITKAGHNVEIDITEGDVEIHVKGDITLNVEGTVNATVSEIVNLDAEKINFCGGTAAVARLGDSVQVSCPLHGSHSGTITSGSSKVFSG